MLRPYGRKAANEAHLVIFVAIAALASAIYLAIEAAAWVASLPLAWRLAGLGAGDALFA